VIELDRVPRSDGVAAVAEAAGVDPNELALDRGEDYELLVTLPEERVDGAIRAVEASGGALTRIGIVREGAEVLLIGPDGSRRTPSGFDQLRG
jgi:thiamine monophosphate kinase